MSVAYTLLALLAFVVLTLGTAVFVAAEFSLTALERSTVDANARTGGRRDHLIQRAHKTLSFQLSGAQVGISVTTLITGYLAEPLIARLLRARFRTPVAERKRRGWPGPGALATDRHVGVDGLRRTGCAVPRGGQTVGDGARGGRTAGAVLDVLHPGDQTDERRRQLDPAPPWYRARRGTSVGAVTAGTRFAGPQLRASRRPRPGDRRAGRPVTAVRVANRRGADDTAVQDRGPTGRPERRRPCCHGDGDRLLPLPHRRGRPGRDDRPRARQTGLRGRARRAATHHACRPGHAWCPWCRQRSTATT